MSNAKPIEVDDADQPFHGGEGRFGSDRRCTHGKTILKEVDGGVSARAPRTIDRANSDSSPSFRLIVTYPHGELPAWNCTHGSGPVLSWIGSHLRRSRSLTVATSGQADG